MQNTERAVERLTQDHTEHTDAGATEWPPLITWLEQSVTEMVKRGGAGSGGAGIPIDFEALRLLDSIKKDVRRIRKGLFMFGRTPELIEAVKTTWEAAKHDREHGKIDDTEWEIINDTITGWAASIEGEQSTRPRKMELIVPCPRCGHRWIQDHIKIDGVDVPDPNGERKAAVVIEFGEGRAPVAECRVADCEAIWAGWKQVGLLGVTVGAEQNLAILEAAGIKLDFGTPEMNDNGVIQML